MRDKIEKVLDNNIDYYGTSKEDLLNELCILFGVSKRLFDVTYQGQDDEGLIVRTITVQAENASEAAEKVRQCGMQLRIYSSNAC